MHITSLTCFSMPQDSTSPPKWPVRLKVLRDVADALKYLHTACTPAVVHRDVKRSGMFVIFVEVSSFLFNPAFC